MVINLLTHLAVSSALAQADPPQVAQARAHFANGERFYESGQFAQSLIEFRRTFELLREVQHRNAALVLFNVARCYVQLGREREAIAAFEQFLAEAPDDAPFIGEARSELRELRARVSLDGSADGGISPVGPILVAVGAAALLAGAVTGGLALAADGSADEGCVDGRCPAAHAARANEAQALAAATDALLFGGLAVAAAGIVLLFVLPSGGQPTPVAAACTERGCVLTVGGWF